MNYYAGLDVSLEETSVCEGKALSEPAAIASCLLRAGVNYKRIGIEAGPLSQWPYRGLRAKKTQVSGY